MAFQRRTYAQILADMVAHIEANTQISDFRIGAVIRSLLEACALEDDEQYLQMAFLLRDFSIATAVGAELDRRLLDFDLTREPPRPSLGTIIITAPEPVGATGFVLAAPIRAYNDATPQFPRVEFQTTATAVIPPGARASGPIPIVATRSGSDTNIPAGRVRFLSAPIPGLPGATCTNPISCRLGRDEESDDEFRARGRRHLRSLPRGTVAALEGAALGSRAFSLETRALMGGVNGARLREERPGESTLFVLDATNRFAQTSQTIPPPGDTVLVAASLGQRHHRLPRAPILPQTLRLELEVPGISVPLVLDTANAGSLAHLLLDDTTGVLTFLTLPTSWSPDPQTPPHDYAHRAPLTGQPAPGLPAGTRIRAAYTFRTGLLAEVQRGLEGDAADRSRYPGWKAAGTRVRVRVPIVREVGVHLAIVPEAGFQRAELVPVVGAGAERYVNTLDLGEELIVARLIDLAMSVRGVHDANVLLPRANVPALEDEVLRAGIVLVH